MSHPAVKVGEKEEDSANPLTGKPCWYKIIPVLAPTLGKIHPFTIQIVVTFGFCINKKELKLTGVATCQMSQETPMKNDKKNHTCQTKHF